MRIRKTGLRDYKDIAEIEWKSGYRWNTSYEECLTLAEKMFREGYCDVYILENKKTKIGYVALSFKGKMVYLNLFGIKKEFQGQGLSKRLMEKSISLAKRKRAKAIELAVWAKNVPAIALYTTYGFYVTEIKHNYYKNGDDKLRMRKDLR